jgi:hypothetical protein
VVATGGASAAATTETAGNSAVPGAQVSEGANSATPSARETGPSPADVPAPPVPAPQKGGSPDSPPAPLAPAAEEVSTGSSEEPLPPQDGSAAQSLARKAADIEVPHDGSGHAPPAQLRVDREE